MTRDIRRRDRRSEAHARIAREHGAHLIQHISALPCVNRSPDVDAARDVARHRRDRPRQVVDAFDRIEAPNVADGDWRARRALGRTRLAHEVAADTETVDRELARRRAVANDRVVRPLGEQHEPIYAVEEVHLAPLVEGDRRGHPERRPDVPEDAPGGFARTHRHERRRIRRPFRQPALLQVACSAFADLAEPVAQRLAPAHHRAARADVSEAARVRRRDDARTGRFRGLELGNFESRHQRVKVRHVRPRRPNPVVKPFAPAHRRAPLGFGARQGMRDRKAVNDGAAVRVGLDAGDPRIGRDDLDAVTEMLQT